MTMRRSDWLWLGGILGLAAVLRAINLDAGLWYDEIVTLVESVRLPTSELVTSYKSFNSHILFSLEAQACIALLGESAWSLRLPASVPFLFASLRVGVAASLVGTVVAELTQSADGGFGARLLAGSYYGQTIQIWATLFIAAALAAILVILVGWGEKLAKRRMGVAA